MFFSPTIEQYVANSLTWIGEWVKQRRNHAAIALWSAENENGVAFPEVFDGNRYTILSDAQILLLASAVHGHDPYRPVGCDGDQLGSAKHEPNAPAAWVVTNYHYPEGYGNSWGATEASIYLPIETEGRPNACGEFVTDYQSTPGELGGGDNKLWHGLVVRGLRYTGWADIRPYTLEWAHLLPGSWPSVRPPADWSKDYWAAAVECLRNGLAAVALFDRAYDDLGPVPAFKTLPVLLPLVTKKTATTTDSARGRGFVLYNDEFVGSTNITAGWALQSNATGAQLGVAQLAVDVPVGEHVDITCQLSHNTSSDHACEGLAAVEVVDLVLTAAKLGQQKYREVKRFRVASSKDCPLTAGSVAIECSAA